MSTRSRRSGSSSDPPPPARPAARQGSGRLELATGGDVSRLFIFALATFVHRTDLERRILYAADLDLASVAETVGVAAIEAGMRDPRFREAHSTFNSIVGVDGQRPVNALSIAEATGIPRETVRRKLKRLVELGFIVEHGRGRYVVTPGSLQRPEHLASFERGIREAVRFMNDCLEQGLVRWQRGPRDET